MGKTAEFPYPTYPVGGPYVPIGTCFVFPSIVRGQRCAQMKTSGDGYVSVVVKSKQTVREAFMAAVVSDVWCGITSETYDRETPNGVRQRVYAALDRLVLEQTGYPRRPSQSTLHL